MKQSNRTVPVQSLRGRWWTPDGWMTGLCRFDERVLEMQSGVASDPVVTYLPAPVDLHVHGGGGFDCLQGEASIRGMLLAHADTGTGALLATSVTAPFATIEAFLEAVQQVMHQPEHGEARLLGAHLEGPFISPEKLGAQPPFAAVVDVERFERWLMTGVVKVVTLAPELAGADQLIELCHQYRCRPQLGHTNCSWAEARRALNLGCGVTHLFNAMSGVSHRNGGAAVAALAYADYAEIITDGLHVDQPAFEAARRSVPRLYSVTDATAATGMPDGDYRLGEVSVIKRGDSVRLTDGTLAGSCLTQRTSIERLRQWGLGWLEIGQFTSYRPARWLGESQVGVITAGAFADWLEVQNDRLVARWHGGRRMPFARFGADAQPLATAYD